MNRRVTPTVWVGGIAIGGQYPVRIQSMTNTPTADVTATVTQICELADAGSELVRITVNDFDAMQAVPEIVHRLRDGGFTVPIVGDFHYNGHILLQKYPDAAQLLDKYRINPGNVGKRDKHDQNFSTIIKIANTWNKPCRIGVNWGSLDPELVAELMDANAASADPKPVRLVQIDAMVRSAVDSANRAIELGLSPDRLIISVKMSEVQDMVAVYSRLAAECPYALHLGLTEAGGRVKGLVTSSAALAILLQQGIGDTIRMSLTPEPGVSRALEVIGCRELLQGLGLRHFRPSITSCPGCGRTKSDFFIHLASEINDYIDQKMPEWKVTYPGVEMLKIAVMGCVVNGPGESQNADIGISLPGASEQPAAPVYIDGKLAATLRGERIREQFISMLNDYLHHRFSV